jgi:hypothetical protein
MLAKIKKVFLPQCVEIQQVYVDNQGRKYVRSIKEAKLVWAMSSHKGLGWSVQVLRRDGTVSTEII